MESGYQSWSKLKSLLLISLANLQVYFLFLILSDFFLVTFAELSNYLGEYNVKLTIKSGTVNTWLISHLSYLGHEIDEDPC